MVEIFTQRTPGSLVNREKTAASASLQSQREKFYAAMR